LVGLCRQQRIRTEQLWLCGALKPALERCLCDSPLARVVYESDLPGAAAE
jgi:hypothetical protein